MVNLHICATYILLLVVSCSPINNALASLRLHRELASEFRHFLHVIREDMRHNETVNVREFAYSYEKLVEFYTPPQKVLKKFMQEAYNCGYKGIGMFMHYKLYGVIAPELMKDDPRKLDVRDTWLLEAIETCNIPLFLSLKEYVYKEFSKDEEFLCWRAAVKCLAIYESLEEKKLCREE